MPSAADLAAKGADALSASQYAEAIRLYTEAIAQSPTAVDYYIKRSTAYGRDKKYDEALRDAEQALFLARSRGKRELIGQAQMRRGITLFQMDRFADAEFTLHKAKAILPNEKTIPIWEAKAKAGLAKNPGQDIAVEEYVTEPNQPTEAQQLTPADSAASATSTAAAAPAPSTPAVPPAPQKVRHEWYQTPAAINLTFFAKGIPSDKVSVQFQPITFSISFPLADGSDYIYEIDPLGGKIDVENSSHKVMSTKIEIKLAKATGGQQWATLEGAEVLPDPKASVHAYPTSSRNGPKNWESLSTNLDSATGPDAEPIGDAALNQLFQTLYKDADEDTRKAMIKSYTESGGTKLSTNWSEVGKEYQAPTPPEGMEARKWS
ncbi:SGS-domain-containing protein [Saitoella complicata NRRL Y-17804]|nr:SGS-domain-containing protein [Saitoella complicata NRRL Y-17804]ODQ56010.1 SGS-domain-containing protein [Saitoella complicata NRRL Y-17804]